MSIFAGVNWIIMSCILHIETSTDVCSVAVSEDAHVIFEQENREGHNHATLLGPFVRDALSFADSHAIPVDAVAVSSGPGSYTGLRIGVSEAKGVAYGLNIPLISVPTLKLMCVPLLLYREDIISPSSEGLGEVLLCPMIDARRMEVYAAVYNRALRPVRDVQPDIVTAETYKELLDRHIIYFFGSGSAKCKEVIQHPNARFIDDIVPLAKHMAPLAEMAHVRGEFVDTAYFEPFYLKEFQATVAKRPF